jgi:molecular chaperone GrpE
MRKGNGKTDTKLDLEHELPAAADDDTAPLATAGAPVEAGAGSGTEKLKAERDALLDRLARLQAEFDNARKRAVREQQDFREFAAADVIKNFLPILDSFERALKAGGDSGDFRNEIGRAHV